MKLILAASQSLLYHNTSAVALLSILEFGAIARVGDFDTKKGWTSIKKGWVSFTRDSKYKNAPGATSSDVRFVFDYDTIRRGYKTRPHSDGLVVKDRFTETFVDSYERRWESEELVMGPVWLKHGLDRIEVKK